MQILMEMEFLIMFRCVEMSKLELQPAIHFFSSVPQFLGQENSLGLCCSCFMYVISSSTTDYYCHKVL